MVLLNSGTGRVETVSALVLHTLLHDGLLLIQPKRAAAAAAVPLSKGGRLQVCARCAQGCRGLACAAREQKQWHRRSEGGVHPCYRCVLQLARLALGTVSASMCMVWCGTYICAARLPCTKQAPK